MNESLQQSFDDERRLRLPSLLARFIEAYECGPYRAEYILQFKHLLGRFNEAENPVNEKVALSLCVSDKESQEEIYEKTLHSETQYYEVYEKLLANWHKCNSMRLYDELNEDDVLSMDSKYTMSELEKDKTPNVIDHPLIIKMIETQARDFEDNPNLKKAFINRLNVPVDIASFDLALRMFQSSENEQELLYFTKLKQAHMDAYWAKELVGLLPTLMIRSEELRKHPIAKLKDVAPDSLKALFEQAHLAFIFGLDIPCTLTCGALIEEAFKVRFKVMFDNWDIQYKSAKKANVSPQEIPLWKKLAEVVTENPFAKYAEQSANKVWKARSDAIHNPQKYINQNSYRSGAILADTRKVLEILFDPNHLQR